mgnify:CR=1 FL=1
MLKVTKLSASSSSSSGDTAKYYKEHDKKTDNSLSNKEFQSKADTLNTDAKVDKDYGDYVLADKDEDTKHLSQWGGKLAQELGIEGKQVTQEMLKDVLDGKLGDKKVATRTDGTRRMGYDFTFSAPKSASLLGLVHGDKRLLEAHVNAVKEAMSVMSQISPEQRIRNEKGEDTRVATDNIMYAMETHKTSREQDPQIHTHALVVNMTQNEKGDLRAIDMDKFFNEKQNTYLGNIYQNAYRKEVENMGYKTYDKGSHGQFEIEGVSEQAIEHFSKRRQQILEIQKEKGASKAGTVDEIAKMSRVNKKHLSKEELNAVWDDGRNKYDYSELIKDSYNAINISKDNTINSKQTADDAINRGISYLSRYSTKLNHNQILEKSFKEFNADNKLTYHDLKEALDTSIVRADNLIPLDKNGTSFTTQKLINQEKIIQSNLHKSSSKFSISPTVVNPNYDVKNIESIRDTLGSKSQVGLMTVSGDTRDAISCITESVNSADKNVHIVGTNTEQLNSNNLEGFNKDKDSFMGWISSIFSKDKSDNKADTLGSFLYKSNNNDINLSNKDVVVVDMANKLSISDTEKLTNLANSSEAKFVFLNQTDSSNSFSAGNVIDTFREAGVHESVWNRVKEKDTKSMHIHEDKDYLSLASKVYKDIPNRDSVQVITSYSDKNNTNNQIRSELMKNGELSENKTIQATKDIRLNNEHGEVAQNYPIGANIAFFKDKQAFNYTIVGHDLDNNRVITKDKNGKEASFDPLEAKQSKARITENVAFNYAEGETIRVDKGSKNGLSVGEYLVTSIKGNKTQLANVQTGETRSYTDKVVGRANLSHTYAKTINQITYDNDKDLMCVSRSFGIKEGYLNELQEKTKESLTIITDNAEVAQKSMLKSSIKDTAISTTIEAANSKQDKTSDIYADLTGALDKLNTNYNKDNIAKAVEHAVDIVNQREAVFGLREVFDIATKYAKHELGEILDHKDISSQLNSMSESGELISNGNNYTTLISLEQEKAIINIAKESKDTMEPLARISDIEEHFDKNKSSIKLSDGQKEATKLICTNTDKFTVIQGYAGVGKSTMLSQVQDIVTNSNDKMELHGLAPTKSAVAELEKVGIKSQTLQSFLADENNHKGNDFSNKLFVLDEYSMVANKDFMNLATIINDSGSRMAALGDRQQLESLESGSPIDLLRSKDLVKTAEITEIHRQKTTPYLNTIKSLIKGDASLAVKNLNMQNAVGTPYEGKQNIVDISKDVEYKNQYDALISNTDKQGARDLTMKALSNEYLSRDQETRDKTLIVTGAHADRDKIHEYIREGLCNEGTLDKTKSITVERMRNHNLTEAQFKEFEYQKTTYKDGKETVETLPRYKEGMVYQQGNDRFYKVLSADMETKSVRISDIGTGKESIIYPANMNHKYSALYDTYKSEISVGDKLMVRNDDKSNNIIRNDRLNVTDIKDGLIYGKNDDKEVVLDSSNPKHMIMEYGYTSTSHNSQGMTVDSVLSYIKSSSPLSTIKSWYVQFSRGREHAMMFTDNLDIAVKNITNKDKSMAHSVVENLAKIENTKVALDKTQADKLVTGSNVIKDNKPKEVKEYDSRFVDEHGKFDYRKYGPYVEKELVRYTEDVSRQYLGAENKKSSNAKEMAFGSGVGSLKVSLNGEHRGSWVDWATNERGTLLTLIMRETNQTYAEAVDTAANMISAPEKFSIKEVIQDEKNKTIDTSKVNNYGKQVWNESVPIKGTLAEKYLNNRGISDTDSTGLRYHPRVYSSEIEGKFAPALVAAFQNNKQEIQAVEVVYLDKETANKAEVSTAKRSYGSKSGAAINVTPFNRNTEYSMIAEGSVTALSVKEAYPDEHVLAVGGKENIANIDPEILNDKVIICADNDGNDIATDSALNNSISRLEEAGKTVEIIAPADIDGMSKVDFNDVLNRTGVEDISNIIDKVIDMSHENMLISDIANELNMSEAELENAITNELDVTKLDTDYVLSELEKIDVNIDLDELLHDIDSSETPSLDEELEL